MRILLCRGVFSPDGMGSQKGLTAFCHLHKNDNDETVSLAASKIALYRQKKERVTIAPFSYLDEKSTTMNFDEAEVYFKRFAVRMPGAVVLPLKYPEIHLDLVPPNDFVKFIEI